MTLLPALERICCCLQAVVGGSEEESKEKAVMESLKGDEFMELKYVMMKKLEEATVVFSLIRLKCSVTSNTYATNNQRRSKNITRATLP